MFIDKLLDKLFVGLESCESFVSPVHHVLFLRFYSGHALQEGDFFAFRLG